MSVTPIGLYQRLQRVTTTGLHIPSLDGLRFFAIMWVALYHLHGSFSKKAPSEVLTDSENWFHTVMSHGRQGVPLFFALSGFFLCLPFARQLMLHGEPLNFRAYYSRRFLRIAPPYWISAILVFVLCIVLEKYSFTFLIPRLAATLGFVYTLVFQEINTLNSVFWALEVEIQFYLIAPLLAYLYFTMPKTARRLVVVGLVVALPFIQIGFTGIVSSFTLPNFVQYFLAGFLVCDIYISGEHKRLLNSSLLPLVVLPLILLTAYDDSLIERICYPVFIIILYLSILFNPLWDKIFSWRPAVAIGGISYSIYLIHFPIIGFLGTYTMPIQMTGNYYLDFLIQCLLILPVALILSYIFYLAAERPFMKIRPYKRVEMSRDKVMGSDMINTSK